MKEMLKVVTFEHQQLQMVTLKLCRNFTVKNSDSNNMRNKYDKIYEQTGIKTWLHKEKTMRMKQVKRDYVSLFEMSLVAGDINSDLSNGKQLLCTDGVRRTQF